MDSDPEGRGTAPGSASGMRHTQDYLFLSFLSCKVRKKNNNDFRVVGGMTGDQKFSTLALLTFGSRSFFVVGACPVYWGLCS